MKKILLILCVLVINQYSFSQISITATAGTTGPTSYTTLQTAFDAVNAGTHKGYIAITVNGNTTETNTSTLNASGSGAASYTTLLIKPGSSAVAISGNIAGPLIDLNGADSVTINGLNNGGASLSLSNTSVTAAACTIRLINDATGNTIQNVMVTGASNSPTTGTIFFSTGTTTGNDNNLLANCTISDAAGSFPVNAIYSSGNNLVNQENSNNTISNNNISNFFAADQNSTGVLLVGGNTDWTISGNRFFQTAARTFTTNLLAHRALQIAAGQNYTITANTIGFATADGTGTYTLGGAVTTRFLAIDLAVGSNIASTVQNNIITNISFQTSANFSSASGIWCGINISGGFVNVVSNRIGALSGNGAITVNPTVGGTLTVGITSSSTFAVTISNNRIAAIDVMPSGVLSGNLLGIQTQGSGGPINISGNTVGNNTENSMRVGILGTTTGNGIIRGILNSNTGNINISGNIIQNLTHNSNNALALFRAIECQQGNALIEFNTIKNIMANGASLTSLTPEGAGILATTGGLLTVNQNTISNLNVTNTTTATGTTVTGIYVASAVSGAIVTQNKLYGFTNAGTSTSTTLPGIIAGVYCRDAPAATPNILIANNMISFGNAQTSNTAIIGVWNAAASANGLTTKLYYNSINIEGAVATGAQPSFCYYRGDFSSTAFTTPNVDIKNNIFNNSRTGGTGKHYAIANSYGAATSNAGGWGVNASNYNVLNANAAAVGYWSGDRTFAGWQAASGGDANSLSGLNLIFANPASGDLHLTNTVDIVVDGKATPLIAVTNDFDDETRNAATPDIGADEFNASALPITIVYFTGNKQGSMNVLNWKANSNSLVVTFDLEHSNDGRKFSSMEKTTATQARCLLPFTVTDKTPIAGINYYRLKMTEADGTGSYSNVIAILNKETGFEALSLASPIVNKTFSLQVFASRNTLLRLLITDLTGRTVYQQTATAIPGLGSITIDAGNLINGIFQLTCLPENGEAKTFRFVKQ